MSYCVNCGVKLAQNINICPLCGVSVINPAKPIDLLAEKIYPQNREHPIRTFDRGLWIKIVTIVIVSLILVSMTLNRILNSSGIDWSIYVVSSLGLVWVWLISPFLFKHIITSRWIFIDILAVLGFLYIMEWLSPHKGWFLMLALPICSTFLALILSLVFLIRKKYIRQLQILAATFLVIGAFCVLINAIINLYNQSFLKLDWSLLVLIPFTAFAIIAVLLQRRAWVVEELKHWFRI
jgi:hypothetical protein